MPRAWGHVVYAERFGIPPEWVEELPADRHAFYLSLLHTEAETLNALEGQPRDDPDIRLYD